MVESHEDSISPSPVLRGEERQNWGLFVGRMDLVDARLCATRSGTSRGKDTLGSCAHQAGNNPENDRSNK
ncbi:hypothetical protein R1sor_022500 [Riccia sorocarpa]|uniref:Uncharacterized protein n=1 Tax=Riccia sorocarpa TaxID=122646 RepID=A0ABD3GM82_9MARC